jgi:Ni2+-binding GTPase involved in maturation of urease and hydrogenase
MRLVTFAGGPSVGKTSVILRVCESLQRSGARVGVVKFDSLSTADDRAYALRDIPVTVGLSGAICPDHFFVSNVIDCWAWGKRQRLDFFFSESAGLCNRCSPHLKDVLAVCVVDVLAGIHTPKKIGPMLRLADIVVVTKGDIVSQVEREVFAHHVRLTNPGADALFCNGITGQGAARLASFVELAPETEFLEGRRLRFPMPSAICPYCVGETALGETHQRGNVKKMQFCDRTERE